MYRHETYPCGISSATVGRIARNMPERIRDRGGRPRLLSANDKRKITRDVTSGNYDTAVQAAAGLAHNAGMVVSANSMEFAIRHKDWTVDDWRKVVWSDETKINRLGSDGREWCWKYRGESLSNRTCQPRRSKGI